MILNNISDTIKFAQNIASSLKKGDIILLKGDLGAGKTTIAAEIIRYLAKNPELVVTSPTFPILQIYELGSIKIYHFDLYRLRSPREALELGLEEAFENGICLIEWPEIIIDTLNSLPHILIDVKIVENEKRECVVTLKLL
jgi:tRNA threonylcarbamoyl adenosine modification protein YjeE